MFRFKFSNIFLKFYRVLAFAVLFGTIAIMLGYLSLVGFYTLNNSWIAPVIISPTNEKMLRLKAELFNVNQALDKINVDIAELESGFNILKNKKNSLILMRNRLNISISSERNLLQTRVNELNPLVKEKASDSKNLINFSKQLKEFENSIDKELEAGLITKEEALKQKSSILSLNNSATDSIVQSISINNATRDLQRNASTLRGSNEDIRALEVISKRVELETDIAQLDVQILSNLNSYNNFKKQKNELTRVIETLKQSPYFKITTASNKINFAFITYDNQKNIKIGSNVYDCFLHMIICKKVGIVSNIYSDEETAKHFLLKTDLRGSFIELNLTDKSAGKSDVLFVNSKPLLF